MRRYDTFRNIYSSAVFQDFAKFPPPEITMKPLDDLVLGMKNFGIEEIKNFPFVTIPNEEALKKWLVSESADLMWTMAKMRPIKIAAGHYLQREDN